MQLKRSNVAVLPVLIVGVVKGVDVAVLTVDTDAVVPVVSTGVLAVVCDSVVNVVSVVIVSITQRGHKRLQQSKLSHTIHNLHPKYNRDFVDLLLTYYTNEDITGKCCVANSS